MLIVPFTYGKKGPATVTITAETPISESGMASPFSGIRTLDTVRETGFIGVELATSAEVSVSESVGLEKIVVQKLPRPLINRSARPLIMGFKYLKHPYSLVFDIEKHEKIAVPAATINFASVVTLFTEDGKIVHRLVYQIRNSAKQFLEIRLPESVDVWSVLVGGRPVESSMDGRGRLLVPLIRSRSVDNRLETFPVEVIYCAVQDGFAPIGSQVSALPTVDLLISQLMWSVYLPNDYSYVYFKSTLEKEEIIRGVNVFANVRRQYDENAMKEMDGFGVVIGGAEIKKAYRGKDYRSYFRNVPMDEVQLSNQLKAELEFGGRLEGLAGNEAPQASVSRASVATGVLPIQVRVPTSGQVYRFAKTIIRPEDPLAFSVTYTRSWVVSLLKWIIATLIALVIYLNRRRLKRIGRWTGEKANTVAEWARKRQGAAKRYAQSGVTPVVLSGLAVVTWGISGRLAFLFVCLLLVSVSYQLTRLWKKRMQMSSRT